MDLNPWVQVIGGAAVIVAAVATIWRKGIKPLFAFMRSVERIAEATPILVEIAYEFRPNSGGSLRDTVDRIEKKVDDASAVVTRLESADTTQSERMDALATRLDNLASRVGLVEAQSNATDAAAAAAGG